MSIIKTPLKMIDKQLTVHCFAPRPNNDKYPRGTLNPNIPFSSPSTLLKLESSGFLVVVQHTGNSSSLVFPYFTTLFFQEKK